MSERTGDITMKHKKPLVADAIADLAKRDAVGASDSMALVMPGWVDNPRRNQPPEGVIVEVKGTDYMGTWYGVAMRKDYKPGSTRKQLKRGWRWCYEDGTKFDDQAIDAWKMR